MARLLKSHLEPMSSFQASLASEAESRDEGVSSRVFKYKLSIEDMDDLLKTIYETLAI